METVRLFDDSPYETRATAKVLRCESTKTEEKECYVVELDQTIFFPEEGGQSPDRGTINGIEVIDVQVEKKSIIHYLSSALDIGSEVKLELDWNHRFSNMQQHSGEHIFSGTVNKLFGFDNVGFHLSDNSVTMDFNGVLSPDDIVKVERIVNEAIAANVEISAKYVDATTLAQTEYRSKKEIDGAVRLVTIPGYDVCACCAPHVRRTGEIGQLKVIHTMNYKGGVRINILCGFRALEYYGQSIELIDELTEFMSTGRETLVEYIKKLKADNQNLSSQLLESRQKLLREKLASIPDEQENVIVFDEKTDNLIMKNTVNLLKESHDGIIAFFSGSDEEGYNYMISSNTRDSREVQKLLVERFKAKGGGKPEMVCGSLQATSREINDALQL